MINFDDELVIVGKFSYPQIRKISLKIPFARVYVENLVGGE